MNKYLKGFTRYRFLLSELVKKGIKLKYRRSYLGIIWTLIEPLLTMIVLTLVFGTLFNNRSKEFPVYILTGRLLFSAFSSGTNGAMRAIRSNSGMIKKVYAPKYLYPLSNVIFNYIIFLISLIVLAVVAIVLGVYPTRYLAQALVSLTVLFSFTLGVGMILGTVSVFFRDLEYLWSVILMLVMYTSAIFYYPNKILKSNVGVLLKYNPLFCIVDNFRSAIFGSPMNMKYMTYSILCSAFTLIVGFYIFYKNQDKFILHI